MKNAEKNKDAVTTTEQLDTSDSSMKAETDSISETVDSIESTNDPGNRITLQRRDFVFTSNCVASLKKDGTVDVIDIPGEWNATDEIAVIGGWTGIASLSADVALLGIDENGSVKISDDNLFYAGKDMDKNYLHKVMGEMKNHKVTWLENISGNDFCIIDDAGQLFYTVCDDHESYEFQKMADHVVQIANVYYLTEDGSVSSIFESQRDRLERLHVNDWGTVCSISYIMQTGDVVALTTRGEVKSTRAFPDIDKWENIVSICTSQDVIVGVDKEGAIHVATRDMKEWKDIVSEISNVEAVCMDANAQMMAVRKNDGSIQLLELQ